MSGYAFCLLILSGSHDVFLGSKETISRLHSSNKCSARGTIVSLLRYSVVLAKSSDNIKSNGLVGYQDSYDRSLQILLSK